MELIPWDTDVNSSLIAYKHYILVVLIVKYTSRCKSTNISWIFYPIFKAFKQIDILGIYIHISFLFNIITLKFHVDKFIYTSMIHKLLF